jgi:beta-alanine--pyruvate transaminase
MSDHATRLDLDAFWMPFTANRRYKDNPRIFFESASGMYYTTTEGRRVMDCTAGLWCVAAGHGRQSIAAAVMQQLQVLDYAPAFQAGHPQPFALASRIAALAPAGMDQVFFTTSGSESVDSALKIAIAYHRSKGNGQKLRFISRERAYHGVNFGGLSVGGIGRNRRQFALMLPGVDFLPHTHDLAHMAFSRGQPAWGVHLADDLERLVELHDASTIAAVIVEPVAAATGVLVPPQGYLQRLREICTRHDILLIFDEVVTGFGRLGTAFAAQFSGVTPDLMTFAKAVTNATIPLGGVIVSSTIGRTIQAATDGIELFHGYTHSGHPVACAAAQATLDIYQSEDLFQRVCDLAPYWERALHSLAGEPHVIDVRNIGLLGAIELAPSRDKGAGVRALTIQAECFRRGIFVRPLGDSVVMSPPFIIEPAQIDEMVEALRQGIRAAVAS